MKTKKILLRIGAVLVFTALILIFLDIHRGYSLIKRAKNLREGDSCVKVEELLGSPNYVSHSLLFTEETWTYGTYLDPYFFKKFPYIIPFKMRALFSHNDDIVIGFDMSGDVVSIEIPNK